MSKNCIHRSSSMYFPAFFLGFGLVAYFAQFGDLVTYFGDVN